MSRTLLLMFVIVLGIALSGCSFVTEETSVPVDSQQTNTEAQANPQAVEEEPAVQETPAVENEAAEEITLELKQYFGSKAYVYDGTDEENGMIMPAVSQSIKIAKDDNPYMAAVNSLQTVPGSEYYTALSKSYKINGITVSGGVATVDFSSDGLLGGDVTEMVLIDQIVYTLINSFSDIDSVMFTVDGAKAESLMGSVDITEKFTGDSL